MLCYFDYLSVRFGYFRKIINFLVLNEVSAYHNNVQVSRVEYWYTSSCEVSK